MTKIEWTDATWNPIRAMFPMHEGTKMGWHCEHVSEGCRNCYAEKMNLWRGTGFEFKPGHLMHKSPLGDPRGDVSVWLDEKMLTAPLRGRKPRMVFVCSMTDLFGDWVPDEWIDQIFAVMALCPQHVFQVLTKRPERMREYISRANEQWHSDSSEDFHDRFQSVMGWEETKINSIDAIEWPLSNVWLGVSVEDQATAAQRIPILLDTPAVLRFVSAEPLLGPVNLSRIHTNPKPLGLYMLDALGGVAECMATGEQKRARKLHWVICGGESGPNARPMRPDWARSLRDQCAAAGAPYFFKQWGEYLPVGQNLPGYGKVHGATAVKPGRMKLHYGGTPKQAPKHAFAECGVEFASTADGRLTFRVGKKRAGDLLDGHQHHAWPEVWG